MIEKDTGFILRRYNFRETSIIADIYTRRYGKIAGIFKGFYTSKREFSSTLDIPTLNELIFYPKKSDVWLVSFAELISDYGYLRGRLGKMKVARACLNLVNTAMPVWDKNQDVFLLLKDTLAFLENNDEYKILSVFLIKFLTFSGFRPQFNRCLKCSADLSENFYFSVLRGGLVCESCSKAFSDIQRISPDAISSMFYVQQNDFAMACRIKFSHGCGKEILHILRQFLAYHMEIDCLKGFRL